MIPIARPDIGAEEEAAVVRVLRSGQIAQGPEVAAFEQEFAALCEAPHAIAIANGTAALHVALLAHGVGPGDEVIIPAFTFAATAHAVVACGATPVFCDVREDDFAIDLDDAAARVTSATRAIVPVHLYGQMAEMEPLLKFAGDHGIELVEDACQAHGARIGSTTTGGSATAVFSFYATKNAASGEGGAIVTPHADIAERARLLRNHGMSVRYVHTTFGLNLRLTDLQAAIARVQVAKLPAANAARRSNAAALTEGLRGIAGMTLPSELPGRTHVWHQYTIRVPAEHRDAFIADLREAGVGADVYYPIPLHKQGSVGTDVSLPVAERLAAEVVALPVHATLTSQEIATVVEAVRKAAGRWSN